MKMLLRENIDKVKIGSRISLSDKFNKFDFVIKSIDGDKAKTDKNQIFLLNFCKEKNSPNFMIEV